MKISGSLLIAAIGVSTSAQVRNIPDSAARAMRYIDEVTVTGVRGETDVRQLPMTVNIIDRDEIEASHDISVLPTVVESVPGFYVTQRGVLGYGVSTGAAGQITVRGVGGSPSTGVLVLIDGHPQYQGLYGHSIADQYQTMYAEKVEVVRGPASVLYGSNAMGGVINIVTRQSTEDGDEVSASVMGGSYGTVQADVSNRLQKRRFGSVVAGNFGRTDGHRDDMEFKQGSGYAKFTFEVSENVSAWTDVNVTKFKASNPGPESDPYTDYDMTILRGVASAGLNNHFARTNGALSIFGNWGNHKINDGYQSGETPPEYLFRSKDQLIGGDLYQSASLFPNNMLTVGLNFQRMGGRAWNDSINTPGENELADVHETDWAVYADMRHDFYGVITAEAGVRFDTHSQAGTEIVPQVGLSWHVNGHSDLRVIASKGFRNPTIRELYMFPPHNPDLSAERLMNYEISWSQYLIHRRLKWGLNIFYIDGENMITTTLVDGKSLNVNLKDVENKGFEVEGMFKLTPHSIVGVNYSYLDMKSPVLSSPEHKLNVYGRLQQGNFRASTNIQYVGGMYTNVTTPKQEDYVLWNADVQYSFLPRWHVFLKVDNILATEYETLEDYPMPKATCMVGIKFN